MSYLDKRRALREIGIALSQRKTINDSDRKFLSFALLRIAAGEDANKVLGVRRGRGEKAKDIVSRKRMSFILHIVESIMYPFLDSDKQDMTLEDACIKAEVDFVPIAKKLFPGSDNTKYSADYIQRCHGAPEYKHMRSPLRNTRDTDFPYAD